MTLVNQKEITLGEEVNFTIPSGNFGNCLAGYIAKSMGLPVKQFIVASNKNNILTDFFRTGKYDANREFYKTNAPAMDILVSSNLERLVYFFCQDSKLVKKYMERLNQEGVYEVDQDVLDKLQKEFKAGYLNEDEVLNEIKFCFHHTGYLLDTHTAIGYGVYRRYKEELNDDTKTILLSTASPYKFPQSVYQALTNEICDDYTAIEKIEKYTNMPISKPLINIQEREILHTGVIEKENIIDFIANDIKGE